MNKEKIRSLASTFYLYKKMPEGLSPEEELEFIQENTCGMFDNCLPDMIQNLIDAAAWNIEKFFKDSIEVEKKPNYNHSFREPDDYE